MENKPLSKQLERYYWLKEHGICTVCGQKDAIGKYVVCEDCLYSKQERDIKNAKRDYLVAKNRKQRYKAEGRCIDCGKVRDTTDANYCSVCREKARKQKREYMRRKRAETKLSPEELHKVRVENGMKNIQYALNSEGLKKWRETLRARIHKEISAYRKLKRAKQV